MIINNKLKSKNSIIKLIISSKNDQKFCKEK